jgi:small subunit ribosomal protein S17
MAIGDTTKETAIQRGERRGSPQTKVGTVVSDRMEKTVVVEVEGSATHRLYHRQVKRTKRFTAHDERNEAKIGDRVLLEATRPLSKSKRWRVREILKRAIESVEVEP